MTDSLTSAPLMKRVQRCYPDAVEVTIQRVFIYKNDEGWANASAGTPYFIRDSLEYLHSQGGKMVELEVTDKDGTKSYPDYNIESLLRTFN